MLRNRAAKHGFQQYYSAGQTKNNLCWTRFWAIIGSPGAYMNIHWSSQNFSIHRVWALEITPERMYLNTGCGNWGPALLNYFPRAAQQMLTASGATFLYDTALWLLLLFPGVTFLFLPTHPGQRERETGRSNSSHLWLWSFNKGKCFSIRKPNTNPFMSIIGHFS